MTTICCINAQNYLGRGKEYVEILFDKVRRNISDKKSFKFVCFTDDPELYSDGIIKKPLMPHLKGWWHKLYLFKKDVFEDGERIIFFDLDTVIIGGLDDILDYNGSFAILRDFYRPEGLGPAVVLWTPTKGTEYIWTYFNVQWNLGIKENYMSIEGGRGDQAILEDIRRLTTKYVADTKGKVYQKFWEDNPLQKIDFLQDIFPIQFVSYKAHARTNIPKGARVVCFHGLPRPHEVKIGWMPDVWKIGGGSVMELEVVGNVNEEILEANIASALSRNDEILYNQYMAPDDRKLLIIGGGPSLEKDLGTISLMQQGGAIVWALNNTFKYLCDHGISPHAHIMLDARRENIDFIPEKTNALLLYSAQCHPDVLQKAREVSDSFIIWCPSPLNINKILTEKNKNGAIIGLGSSVGMKAFGLAELFGFSDIHIFGYDSSYQEGKNHAYNQPLNDGENIIDVTVGGVSFKCAAWMATQVEEFKEIIPYLQSKGISVTVHGEGLLPYVAAQLNKAS